MYILRIRRPDVAIPNRPGSQALRHLAAVYGAGRSSPGFHQRGSSPLRETELPLRQAQRSRPRSATSPSPQSKRQVRSWVLCQSSVLPQSPKRSRRVPSYAKPEYRTDRPQRADLPLAAGRARCDGLDRAGKKTRIAVHQEVTREVESLLRRVFAERRKSGGIDLEAVEMAIRSALHCAGAATLGQLLHYGPPAQQ